MKNQKTNAAIDEQRALLGAEVQKEIVAEKQQLVQRFEQNMTECGLDQSADAVKKGCFPRTVWADQRVNLSWRYGEGDVSQRRDAADAHRHSSTVGSRI